MPVRVLAHAYTVRAGKLTNLSVSGAFLKTDVDLRVLTRVQISLESPVKARGESNFITGYITRKGPGGYGIEWCDFAPKAITALLKATVDRPFAHLPAREAAIADERLRALGT